MTVTVAYDTVLSRVRLTADTLGTADVATVERSTDQIMWTTVRGGVAAPITMRPDVLDTFSRTAISSWGSADTDQPWTTVGGNADEYNVNNGVGHIGNGSVDVLRTVHLDVAHNDFEHNIDAVMQLGSATGAPYTRWCLARMTDTANYYAARLVLTTSGTVNIEILKRVGGTLSAVTGALSAGANAAGNVWRITFKGTGAVLEASVRNLSTGGATTTVSGIDASITSGTKMGLADRLDSGNTNTLPVTGQWDNFSAGPRVAAVDDYEFVAGKTNYYRVRGVQTGAITYVAAGAPKTGNNTSLTPTHPAGLLVGDLKIIFASIRNSGTGTVDTPAGWTLLRGFGNAALLGRIHQAADTAPTVTFTGGVLGADTIAQMTAFHQAGLTPVTGIDQLNGSAQNIAFPALTIPDNNLAVLVAGWKQDDWTSVATLTGFTEIWEIASTAGDGAGQVWDQQIQTTATNITAGSFVVTGGVSAISRSAIIAMPHAEFLNEQTTNITPVLDRIWIKSITRPFLNRPVTVVDWSDPQRPSRGADFDAVGRTLAIGVTDVRGGKQFTLDIYVANRDDAQTLDFIIASGDILFLHTPFGCEIPGGHVLVDTTSERRPHARASSRVFALPLKQIAPPGPDVAGVTSTWQTVLDSYASWEALLAENATWADLLARIAPPSEVIVP